MSTRWKRWWPVVKVVLAAVVVAAVGWSFARDLSDPDLWSDPALWGRLLQPGLLIAAGVLYPMGLAFWCFYWGRLLVRLDQRPAPLSLVRAYYISHLAKYVPGKAWTLLLRAGLARSPKVSGGLAGMTAFYEVLTTMASGALLAVFLLALFGRDVPDGLTLTGLWQAVGPEVSEPAPLDRWAAVGFASLLLAVVLVPLLPPVFNRLANRLSLPFRGKDAPPLPQIRSPALLEGLGVTAVGWLFLGGSFWAVLQLVSGAVTGCQLPLSPELMARTLAALGIAYVAGFLVPFTVGGMGVREYILKALLAAEVAEALALPAPRARQVVTLAVIVLRLAWTAADVVMATTWFLPDRRDKT